jgi:SAM-dependent methyltransferase
MADLYDDLSKVYEAMYQTFIDYSEEFSYYYNILKEHQCTSVVEVGCGTGHLASRFSHSGMQYIGMDLSESMINIAKTHNPTLTFLLADMRLFRLDHKIDAAIITGRTISYLITNDDVLGTFKSIHYNLHKEGILVFDCIDAGKFILQIKNGLDIVHSASHESIDYRRMSHWKPNYGESFLFDWESHYQQKNSDGTWNDIGTDFSTIRTFTKDDMRLMLELCGFSVEIIVDRMSYAFDTFVVVAKKKY